jgi:superfamily II DNA or RNA helicase
LAIIKLGNVNSKLSEASNQARVAVDDALAVETPGYRFTSSYRSGFWDGKTRFFKIQSGNFPTGLVDAVVQVLKSVGEEYTIEDERNIPDVEIPSQIELAHKELGKITLRDYQYESVTRGLELGRGVVNVATNGGKTEIACGLIQNIIPTLKKNQTIAFFTHSKEIFSQSHKRLEERLGISVGKIGNKYWEPDQVNVIMIPTVAKYLDSKKKPKNMDEAKFKEKVAETKKLLNSVVAFIGDEVHHASSDTWYKLFMKLDRAHYRFGLTGTVDDSDPINITRLFGCTGGIITKVSNDFLIEEGHSAKPTIYMMSVDTPKVDAGYYPDARYEGIIYNEDRNRVFMEKVEERTNSGKQSLIIVNETQHGEVLEEILEEMGIDYRFIHGEKSDKSRLSALSDFKEGKFPVLMATTILDEGVDVPNINCLFLVAGGKSLRMILQRIGRGLRKKEDGSGIEVYDALDLHNHFLAEHTMERYRTYKAEGFDIIKI